MPVQNLKSFASIIESCNEEFLEFILDKQKVSLSLSHARTCASDFSKHQLYLCISSLVSCPCDKLSMYIVIAKKNSKREF